MGNIQLCLKVLSHFHLGSAAGVGFAVAMRRPNQPDYSGYAPGSA